MRKYVGQIFDVRFAGWGWVGKQRGRCNLATRKMRLKGIKQLPYAAHKGSLPKYDLSGLRVLCLD